MRKQNIAAIQEATSKALAAQVQRTLAVMRIKGWTFPAECDVAVRILAATALVTQITARMDDVVAPRENIAVATPNEGIARTAEILVTEWLRRHGKKAEKTAEVQ
jgi:hypothetical protein